MPRRHYGWCRVEWALVYSQLSFCRQYFRNHRIVLDVQVEVHLTISAGPQPGSSPDQSGFSTARGLLNLQGVPPRQQHHQPHPAKPRSPSGRWLLLERLSRALLAFPSQSSALVQRNAFFGSVGQFSVRALVSFFSSSFFHIVVPSAYISPLEHMLRQAGAHHDGG